jgi:thiopurine S-methyltransferase
MDLLADDGYHVIGVELSKIAIEAYFEARKVKPSREKRGRFIIWRERNVEIWCGDIFDLTKKELGDIRMLYDCASLTAFSPDSRPHYVEHFHEKLSQQSKILLMTTESPDEHQSNSALSIDPEVRTLYEMNYDIQLLHGQDSLLIDPEYPDEPMSMMEEKVYLIKNHC